MATFRPDTAAETTRQLSRVTRGLALFCVTMVNFCSLFFLFYVMPRIADMLAAVGGNEATSIMVSLPIGLGHFIRGHSVMVVLVFLVLAMCNGWAIYQPNSKVRKRAWLALALSILFSTAIFIMALVSGVNAAMADENHPTVVEAFRFPSGEILTNEFQSDDDFSSNQLYYQANAEAARESMGKIVLEESVISFREPKPIILKEGNRVALVIGAYVFERGEETGKVRWNYTSTNPNAAALSFLRASVVPDGSRYMDTNPFASFGYVYDHLDLVQNVLVTRYKEPKSVKSRSRAKQAGGPLTTGTSTRNLFLPYLVYSAPQYGQPLTFDLARTRAVNGLPSTETTTQ